MNILGVDFGTKRIGLAWVQSGLDVVLPYGIIKTENLNQSFEEMLDLIKKEGIDMIVFGLPFGLEGEENMNTKKIRKFAEEIKKKVGIKIEFIGEEYTTKEAESMGGEVSLDEKSAMLILQSYLSG